jgi:ribosomal protein L37AE/L43A
MDEKDRFGDKLRDVEKGREDQFFAERDRELLSKLKRAKEGETEQTLKEAAQMRCPKCGTRLGSVTRHEVAVNECPSCHGIWLDRGELETIAKRENEGWVAHWLRFITGA